MEYVNRKSVVLISGGLDSATTLAVAKQTSNEIFGLSFRYGQRHQIEMEAAFEIGEHFGCKEHLFLEVPLDFVSSALMSGDPQAVPKGRSVDEMTEGIAPTYVGGRNLIFLSYAVSYAEQKGAKNIWIGVNALDYSGYPDCRPEFINAFKRVAATATKQAVEQEAMLIQTPLISFTKAQIIQQGVKLSVPYDKTISCYQPDSHGLACGECDSCLLREKGFNQAGVPDPTNYQPRR